MTVPRRYAVVLPAYLAGLLALDTQLGLDGQLALGVLTFAVLAVALRPLPPLVRAQARKQVPKDQQRLKERLESGGA